MTPSAKMCRGHGENGWNKNYTGHKPKMLSVTPAIRSSTQLHRRASGRPAASEANPQTCFRPGHFRDLHVPILKPWVLAFQLFGHGDDAGHQFIDPLAVAQGMQRLHSCQCCRRGKPQSLRGLPRPMSTSNFVLEITGTLSAVTRDGSAQQPADGFGLLSIGQGQAHHSRHGVRETQIAANCAGFRAALPRCRLICGWFCRMFESCRGYFPVTRSILVRPGAHAFWG
jgi:hypothetical protein